jgi:hypothetical protein
MDSVKKTIAGYRNLDSPIYSPDDQQASMFVFPDYSIVKPYGDDIPTMINDKVDNDVLEKQRLQKVILDYDISRVSSRNAKKGTKSPYRTGELRQIIQSYGMGKSNGTKKDLVATIRSFHTSRT